jgi:uncharacterized protein YbbC (DUF1343 family)
MRYLNPFGKFLRSKMHNIWLCAGFTAAFASLHAQQAGGRTIMVRYGNSFSEPLPTIRTGAECTERYIPQLQGKKVGLLVNPTSRIGSRHLVDTLVALGVRPMRIFAPEHGFRGEAANGQKVSGGIDSLTGLTIISLYGKHYKPTPEELAGLDVVVFDIQDVGVRFYTYLSTLHYMMEACATANIPMMVLDRPNPNGHIVDGPVLQPAFRSFVGMHPIPMVHGMTLGELARMINGQRWLSTKDTCRLTVIPMDHYHHNRRYTPPVAPSPNLATPESVRLYPSLGWFEGTVMSMGRGTPYPFELIGAPWMKVGNHNFSPVDIPGKAINPPYKGLACRGFLLRDFANGYIDNINFIYLDWLLLSYGDCPNKAAFFTPFFDKLTGGTGLRDMVAAGKTADEIRASWQNDLDAFRKNREPYMLYSWTPEAGVMD